MRDACGESEAPLSHTDQNSPSSFLCSSCTRTSGFTSSHSVALPRENSGWEGQPPSEFLGNLAALGTGLAPPVIVTLASTGTLLCVWSPTCHSRLHSIQPDPKDSGSELAFPTCLCSRPGGEGTWMLRTWAGGGSPIPVTSKGGQLLGLTSSRPVTA